jgi:transposase
MEDLLELYERPLDPREPVVCLDEKPVPLRGECREPILADRPGAILKRDSEYIRKGTANVFCVVEPKAGRHMTEATKNRKAPEYAKTLAKLSRAYPKARTIHLVMDNLTTHRSSNALTKFYGEKRGNKIWQRFSVHYTPKHGSWLNQAEIECGLVGRQCLGKDRIADLESLQGRTAAWNARANRDAIKTNWGFTVEKAREKFHYGRRCGRRRPAAFGPAERSNSLPQVPASLCSQGLRLRRSSVAGARPAPSSLLGSLQNRPAKAGVMSRSED